MSIGAKHLTTEQIILVNDKLREMVERVPTTDGTKKCRFKDGASDDTIATALGVHKSGVQRIRLQVYGQLFSEPKPASSREAELAALRADHAELLDRFNKLIKTLHFKRVADVNHLAITVPLPEQKQA